MITKLERFLRASWKSSRLEILGVALLLAAGFLARALPLLQYSRVGGDPFLHYEYALALLEGKTSVPVPIDGGGMIELHYPPLFHLISLILFLVFPAVDPYAIMKILAATFSALQVIPIFLIAKRYTSSSQAALLASFALLTVRSDYQMLSWGGYANLTGLFFIAALFYCVITDRPILAAILTILLGLSHHLSFIFAIGVLLVYHAWVFWRSRTVPRTLWGVLSGVAASFALFYWFAIESMLIYYPRYLPYLPYDQSLYVTPYVLEQVGWLIILLAGVGIVLLVSRRAPVPAYGKEMMLVWVFLPWLLAYAYLGGVQWHGVRWIHFMPQPLAVWAGVSMRRIHQRPLVVVVLVFVLTLQLIGTLQGYYADILENVVPM